MLIIVGLVLSFIQIPSAISSPPIVLWHGMGDDCCSPLSLGSIMKLIEKEMSPSPYIHSIRIGSNEAEDKANGFFMNVNEQIDYACKLLNNDKNLTNGYHAIGWDDWKSNSFLTMTFEKIFAGWSISSCHCSTLSDTADAQFDFGRWSTPRRFRVSRLSRR